MDWGFQNRSWIFRAKAAVHAKRNKKTCPYTTNRVRVSHDVGDDDDDDDDDTVVAVLVVSMLP